MIYKSQTMDFTANGKGVQSIVVEYHLSTNDTKPANNSDKWTSDFNTIWQTYTQDKDYKYIWSREKTTYTDGTYVTSESRIDNTAAVIAGWCDENDKTLINGANIATGTIDAKKINVENLSAISANLGTMTAGEIQSPYYDSISIWDECTYSQGLEFTLNDADGYVVSIGSCTDSDIVIPQLYNGKFVREIGDFFSFNAGDNITSVTIPDSVTSIGKHAFYNCYNLTSVNFGVNSQLKYIGDLAFSNCRKLDSITLPDSVTFIDEWAFSCCTEITNCILTKNARLEVISEGAFSGLWKVRGITIPDSVKVVGKYAFMDSIVATDVIIGENVEQIEQGAFLNCGNIENVYYKGTSTDKSNINFGSDNNCIIDDATWYYYSDFAPNDSGNYWHGIDGFKISCFDTNMIDSKNFKVTQNGIMTAKRGDIAGWNVTENAIYKKTLQSSGMCSLNLQSDISDGGETDREYSEGLEFRSNGDGTCTLLRSFAVFDQIELIIPPISPDNDKVTSIEASAFRDYDAQYGDPFIMIEKVVIPGSVINIGNYAFRDCKKLRQVIIENGAQVIGEGAFYGCDSLTSVTIPESVTSIGMGAFSYCWSLTSITIPASVTSISSGAFDGCMSLTSIEIPDSVTSIGSYAFRACNSLLEVIVSNASSLQTISNQAFNRCAKLSTITIPESVVSMGQNVFDNCPSLTIYCEANEEPEGWDTTWSGTSKVIWNCNGQFLSLRDDTISSPRFFAGSQCDMPRHSGDAKFLVLEDGSMYASAANISGNVDISRGTIGRLELDGGIKGKNENGIETISLDENGLQINKQGARLRIGNILSFYDASLKKTYFQSDGPMMICGAKNDGVVSSIELMSDEKDNITEYNLSVHIKSRSTLLGNTEFDIYLQSNKKFLKYEEVVLYYRTSRLNGDYSVVLKIEEGETKSDTVKIDIKYVSYLSFGLSTSQFTEGIGSTDISYHSYTEIPLNGSIVHNNPSSAIMITGDLIPTNNTVLDASGNPTEQLHSLGSTEKKWNYAFLKHTDHSSDRKIKDNINDIGSDFSEQLINGLVPKSYTFKTTHTPRIHYGFIAQEVEELLHSLGTSADEVGIVNKSKPGEPDSEDNHYGLNYINLIAPMVSVIQRLSRRVEELENKLNTKQTD